jgi:hypothetical protein
MTRERKAVTSSFFDARSLAPLCLSMTSAFFLICSCTSDAVKCDGPGDCPVQEPCRAAACEDGQCVTMNAINGTACSNPIDGLCYDGICRNDICFMADSELYSAGTVSSNDVCSICDPHRSLQSWSQLQCTEGIESPCLEAPVCVSDGECEGQRCCKQIPLPNETGCQVDGSAGKCVDGICIKTGVNPCNCPGGRALIALPKENGEVFLSWRLLQTDAPNRGFDVYRSQISGSGYQKINNAAITNSTNYRDTTATSGQTYYYVVKPSDDETEQSNEADVTASAIGRNYFKFETRCPSDCEDGRSISNILLADLNGDGLLDFIYQYEHPDNANKVTAHLNDGTWLGWEYVRHISPPDLEYGCHNDAFTAWDLNADGKSEVHTQSDKGDVLI